MASSWAPSSPRPSFHASKKVAFGCVTHQNYTWFKEQFERIIVGYVRDGDGDQLVARARAAIQKVRSSKVGETSGRYNCWKIIEQVMRNLVKGAPVLPHEIAYIRYCVKRYRIDELVKTSSPEDFIRRLYRIVPNDPQRNNDSDLETLLYREGLGPKPGPPKPVSKKDTEGYAFAPPEAVSYELGQRSTDRGLAHGGGSFANPSNAPFTSSPSMSASKEADVKPDPDDLKRRAETMAPESAKRHCRSSRLSPVEQEQTLHKDHLTGDNENVANSSELSDSFTKLLEKQQQLNAKQSIRIAQLEAMVRARDTAVEKAQKYKEGAQDMVYNREAQLRRVQADLGKKDQKINDLAEMVAERDAELKAWKTASPDELRKATKTAQIQNKLFNGRQSEAVTRTRVVLESLQEYLHFLRTADGKNGQCHEDKSVLEYACAKTKDGSPNVENGVGGFAGKGVGEAACARGVNDKARFDDDVERGGARKEHSPSFIESKGSVKVEKPNGGIGSNNAYSAATFVDLEKDPKINEDKDEARYESLEEGEILHND